jgi:hypothetical protein
MIKSKLHASWIILVISLYRKAAGRQQSKDLEFFRAMQDYKWENAQLAAFSSTRKAGVNVEQDGKYQGFT